MFFSEQGFGGTKVVLEINHVQVQVYFDVPANTYINSAGFGNLRLSIRKETKLPTF